MVPEVGIAPTSPPLQGGANLPQLLGVQKAKRKAKSEKRKRVAQKRQNAKAGPPSRLPSRSPQGEDWSSRAVTLRGLPVISRGLCF